MNTELGRTYQDVISCFEGVATGKAFYISGCNQTLLCPTPVDGSPQNKLLEPHWFDDQRLVQTNQKKITLDNSLTPGPDKEAPKR